MIVHPKLHQVVRIHYAAQYANMMPLHGQYGMVAIVAKGPGPRNHGIAIGDDLYGVPCGNLVPVEVHRGHIVDVFRCGRTWGNRIAKYTHSESIYSPAHMCFRVLKSVSTGRKWRTRDHAMVMAMTLVDHVIDGTGRTLTRQSDLPAPLHRRRMAEQQRRWREIERAARQA